MSAAQVLIRSHDRRILVFNFDLRIGDSHHFFTQWNEKYHGNVEFLTIPNPPANLARGAYINSTLTEVSDRPQGRAGVVADRNAILVAKIDEHVAAFRNGALWAITNDETRRRWYIFLRMMVQASFRDGAHFDADQWTLVKAALAHRPQDFHGYDTAQSDNFERCFQNGGAYGTVWWDADAHAKALQPFTGASRGLILPTSPLYDERAASAVTLIPEGEIDRSDTATPNRDHPWLTRDRIVARMNARLPWY